ncbi:MAG: asparagine synthase (glutamine-hydrolyzing) [Pyrinomonadaceae bacterium]|nr:asparagine synthase (glutamine-hydrolyzing) [Pyrinomonadaceae bacterium]
MCGINGIVYSEQSGRMVDVSVLTRMRDSLRHRGPDEKGIFVNKHVGLGHRRLSIVDLKTGQQPMFNDDRSCVIVYNGEVYNHLDLRPEVEALGFGFRTTSDTETILRTYEAFGSECVTRFLGMFSFAIWNSAERELFVARDRFGVKPLYYLHLDDGSFYFASEIKAILETKALRAELNYSALPDYLANHGTSDDQTLFANIKRLRPGHFLKLKDGILETEQYWDLPLEPEIDQRSDRETIEEWFELFEESVRLRLMSDVPLGMFLSGGIDSSAIAAVLSRTIREPIKTFSVAFNEREANELSYARIVAKAFSTDHHEILLSPTDFFKALPRLIWHEDEPLAHPSSVALNFVSQLAAAHVKVVLTGEGSDESLAGYGRYQMTLSNLKLGRVYNKLVPRSIRGIGVRMINLLPLDSRLRHRLRKSFLSLDPTIEAMYFDNFAVFSRSMQSEILSSQTIKMLNGSVDPYKELSRIFNSIHSDSILDRMLYADTKTYLHELLMKQDQMSMAASIESRVPFLDHRLMEFTARLPDRMKLRGFTTKWVLRKAMKGLLPPEILSRSKMGFPVPVGNWFRGPFKHVIDDYVLSDRALDRNIFDADKVKTLAARHMRGENHDERLWALLNFEMWQRQLIEGEEWCPE